MRTRIAAGNWKMNTSVSEGTELAKSINSFVSENKLPEDVKVIVAPPFTHLEKVASSVNGNQVIVAAQNCSTELSGAFTGEVSVSMIKSTGATAVIIGHSERRTYFHETNQQLYTKVKNVLAENMIPIYCCGEVLEERNSGVHFYVVEKQIKEGLFGLSENDIKNVVIAYEPVWAIGTGVVATADQAQEMHAFIRKIVRDKYNNEIADNITILYGGSCKPSNAKELFDNADVDGGLIGGASLKAEDFIGIIKAF